MANYYTHFCFELNVTPEQGAWLLEAVNALVATVDDHPDDAAKCTETYQKYLHDFERDDVQENTGAPALAYNPQLGALVIADYGGESSCVLLCSILAKFLQTHRTDYKRIFFTYADTSQPARIDAFSGGAFLISAAGWAHLDARSDGVMHRLESELPSED